MAPHIMPSAILILHIVWILIVSVSADLDMKRYNAGKDQYELMDRQSQMPKYGQCWHKSMILLQEGCRQLTDEVQTRLALAYLSCFLQVQGRDALRCDPDTDIEDCSSGLSEGDRSSLATFFTHTQNICYFLQGQVWQEETEKTVSRLADSSLQVAKGLEASHKMQGDILDSQNQSLYNQRLLMLQAMSLKDVINSSSDNVKALFEELKLSTQEQGHIMGELFDQLKGLRSAIFGEVFGFYSLVYHVLSIIVCFIVTSTSRTSGARFWLFLVVTLNAIIEQTLLKFIAMTLWPTLSSDGKVNDELLYWLQKQVRRLALFLGLAVLAATAYMYRDVNAQNNHLLTEIRKQNSNICKILSGLGQWDTNDTTPPLKQKEELSDSDYTSDSNNDEGSNLSDAESDKTFILPENCNEGELSEVESFCEERCSETSLLDELVDLKRSTPVREMEGRLSTWLGQWRPSSPGSTPTQHSYNLRKRSATSSANTSPALRVESARSFSKTVEQLQKISEKNSRLVREYVKDQNLTSDADSPTLIGPPGRLLGHANSPVRFPGYSTRQRSATPENLSVSSRASTLRSSRLAKR